MKKLVAVLFGFLIVSVFGACNTSSAVTEIPVIAQSTETKLASPTFTVQAVPTIDPLTPIAIAQLIATQEAIITVTPEASDFLTYEDCGSHWASVTNGNWTLCNGLENPITVMNASGKMWQFSYNSYYGKDIENLCTRLRYLTKDETYLYFSLDPDCELIEPSFILSVSLFRMNLLNGEVNEVLKTSYDFETYDGNYYSISISPTGRRMAYIYPQKSPLTLKIIDLQTGDIHSYPLEKKYVGGGMFAWSEDGTKLVFKLESEKDYNYLISMVFLDLLNENSMVTFIKDKDYFWISSGWKFTDEGVGVILLEGESLFYDFETGILRPMTQ